MMDGELPDSLRPPSTAGDGEIAAYVAEVCCDLRSLVRKPELRTLNYLLDMARLEAEQVAKNARASGR